MRRRALSGRFSSAKAALLVGCALALVGLPSASVARAAAAATTVVCTNGPTFDLKTAKGAISMPEGGSVFMWSFAKANGNFQVPGPVLCVNEGATVTVNLRNNLSEPVSIVFPGQSAVTATGGVAGLFTREAAANGGTVSYSFVAGQPGTYLYESGTNPHKQVQMGLYGALIVRPTLGADYAYNDASTKFDPAHEYLLLLHAIDPTLHRAVEQGKAYNVTTLVPRYWTVNGRAFPDTIADNGAPFLPNQPYSALVRIVASANDSTLPSLVRMANASMFNHPFHPHGNHVRVIAQDGRLRRGPANEDTSSQAFTKTIGSGQTFDSLFRWTDVDAWRSSSNPIPVTIPGQQNLVFKDGATFYSGSPYLGEKGPFQPGITTYNQCGEFYFPWHSHALYEFTNFDEGFGGLATLLRVDPDPCVAPPPPPPPPPPPSPPPPPPPPVGSVEQFPNSTVILTGTFRSGSVANLETDDGTYYQVNSRTTSPMLTEWYGSFTGVPNSITDLRITYKGKNGRTCSQVVSARDFANNAWIALDTRNVGTAEVELADLIPPGTAANYVSGTTGNGEVRVRIRCQTTAGNFVSFGELMKISRG